MEYQVVRTCYHNNRLYEKGEVVTLEGSVPEHFSPLPKPEENGNKAKRTNKKSDNVAAIRGE